MPRSAPLLVLVLFSSSWAAVTAGCGDDHQTTSSPLVTSAGEEAQEPGEPTEPAEPPEERRAAPPDGRVIIVPGRSVGPIHLGMSRAAVDALGALSPHPDYSAMTIPYTVYYDDAGVVFQVEVSFVHAPGDMHVGTAIIPRTAEWSEAKALLGDCSEDDVAEGGTTSRCRGGGVLLNYGSGNPDELWLRMTRP